MKLSYAELRAIVDNICANPATIGRALAKMPKISTAKPEITPTLNRKHKAAESVTETPVKKKKTRPMNDEWIGQEIKTLSGDWGTIIGVDLERRMYKVRVTMGRGRPRLIPETLIEMANFKKSGQKLVERSLEHKMAA